MNEYRSLMKQKKRRISASEIGQFHFCPISWYLQKQGFVPASSLLKRGKKTHQYLGSILLKTEKTKKRIILLRLLGLVFLFIAIIILVLEVFLG